MWCLHYRICITTIRWPSVNPGLMNSGRMPQWLYYVLFGAYGVAICWLWIAVCKSVTNYLIYKTKNYGGSIEAWGVAALTQTIWTIKAANTSIMGKCHSTALGLYTMHYTKSLTFCWRCVSDWGWDHVTISFAHNGCQYVDYGYMP